MFIGAEANVENLIGFKNGGAGILRIGAYAGEVIDFGSNHGTVVHDTNFSLHSVLAGVDIRQK